MGGVPQAQASPVLVGHEDVRDFLKGYNESFTLVGPEAVGKSLIVKEWAKHHDLIDYIVVDGAKISEWAAQIHLLETSETPVVIVADWLPTEILSRAPVNLTVGYLSDADVEKALELNAPKLQPRKRFVHFACGSFVDWDNVVKNVQYWQIFEEAVREKKCVNFKQVDGLPAFSLMHQMCWDALDNSDYSLISSNTAYTYMMKFRPQTNQEARNTVSLFFAELAQ